MRVFFTSREAVHCSETDLICWRGQALDVSGSAGNRVVEKGGFLLYSMLLDRYLKETCLGFPPSRIFCFMLAALIFGRKKPIASYHLCTKKLAKGKTIPCSII
jgi:hypothetical protein